MPTTDLTGEKFGRLTVIGRGPKGGSRGAVWECACECGNATRATTWELTSGRKRSCGCLRADVSRVDIAGERFGRLVALEPTERRRYGTVVWRCRCDCGEECEASLRDLRAGRSTCGGPAHRRASAKPASGPREAASPKPKLNGPRPGQRFGRLVAVEPVGEDINRATIWRCACDCGRVARVKASDLLGGNVTSCGECN